MKEQIYTIPVNLAFEASVKDPACGCPFCTLREKLEKDELDLILGASMMEPDIRIKTNEQGFCKRHFDMMLTMKNRLGLALMLESHLDEVKKTVESKGLMLAVKGKGVAAAEGLEKLDKSCYICGKIDFHLTKMLECAVYLWEGEREFREKTAKQPFFCLPHYRMLLQCAKEKMPKKIYSDFYDALHETQEAYAEKLCQDVSWFCKKFDYRYADEPWGDSKNANERAVAFLRGR